MRDETGEEGDPQYNWRWVWKRKGPDHFALATVYARVGLDRYAGDMAEIVAPKNIFPVAGKQPRVPKKYRGAYNPLAQ